MKNVLILHSWFGSADADWYRWLKTELEKKEYTVCLPDFPELRVDVPDMDVILNRIAAEIPLDKSTTVVGHSIGCLLGMRLAEKNALRSLILVAGWDYDDLCEGHVKFWRTKIDHGKIRENVKNRVVIHSDNDPYYTAIAGEDMSKRLQAKFILIKGAGHFTEKTIGRTFPQLADLF